MHVEPKKIMLSLLISMVIVALGVMQLSSDTPTLYTAKAELASFAVDQDATETNNSDNQVLDSQSQKQAETEQFTPENVKINTDAMTASIESFSPESNNDWSLDLIGDEELEITR